VQASEISYSEFVTAGKSRDVRNVTLDGQFVSAVRWRDMSDRPEDAEVTSLLMSRHIPVRAEPQPTVRFSDIPERAARSFCLIGVWILIF